MIVISALAEVVATCEYAEENFARDRNYWNQYYKMRRHEKRHPSDFAVAMEKKMEPGGHILELGCGNGRDSLFFLEKGYAVTGIDASDAAIWKLWQDTAGREKAKFLCGDFVTCEEAFRGQYDYIYSRFTMHAITEAQESRLLANSRKALRENGKMFIEARTIHDDLYGKGVEVAPHAYLFDGHFRRFLDVPAFVAKMERMGWRVLEAEENRGFSQTASSDPMLLRVIATVSR